MIPPIANNFVAGESAEEAIEHARTVNRHGIKAIINLLGEHYDDPEKAAEDRDQYLDLVRTIDRVDVDATISVKPSQIGVHVSETEFRQNLLDIVSIAAPRDIFVWVDMEDHETTDVTLDAYEDFARKHEGGVGVCLQSNLKRTSDDLERIRDVPGKIRLVKGAYDEPANLSYKDKSRVNERFQADLEYMFSEFEPQAGIAVGSHDQKMVDFAVDLADRYDHDYEFQMLMGVREDEQRRLARQGHEVYQYAPYGTKWFSYFYRRARERKENMLFALRAVLG